MYGLKQVRQKCIRSSQSKASRRHQEGIRRVCSTFVDDDNNGNAGGGDSTEVNESGEDEEDSDSSILSSESLSNLKKGYLL